MALTKSDELWEVICVKDDKIIGYTWATPEEAREAEEASISVGDPVQYNRF